MKSIKKVFQILDINQFFQQYLNRQTTFNGIDYSGKPQKPLKPPLYPPPNPVV